MTATGPTTGQRLTLATVLLVAALSGCAQPGAAVYPHEHVPPEDLRPPVWQVGDYRHYYVTSEQEWNNFTVEALEEKNGHDAYRTVWEVGRPGQSSRPDGISWVDVESLGGVRQQDGDGVMNASPPGGQIFPITNRTYSTTFTTSWGVNQTSDFVMRVDGWKRITLASGVFDTIQISTYYANDLQEPAHTRWYSPLVGDIVKAKAYDHERELRAWGSASGS